MSIALVAIEFYVLLQLGDVPRDEVGIFLVYYGLL